MILWLDTETYSPIPIARGLAKYSTAVEVTVVAWAVDDGPVETWDAANTPMPAALLAAAKACTVVKAHNAQFDETVVTHGLPDLAAALRGKWHCTMVQAMRHGLPGGLDKLCKIFKVDEGEAKIDGHALVMLFCKPGKGGKRNTKATHPTEWRNFLRYAGQDVVAMRVVGKKLPTWNETPFEQALWQLDQRINRRGIAVDVPFAEAAVRATATEQKRLSARTLALSAGSLDRTTQRDKLLALLFIAHGIDLPDLTADTVERRLNDPELPEAPKELLRIRQSASQSSTSKYKRLLDMHVGGRLMFLLQYYGAYRTGRWAGRGFQPQNLKRPSIPFSEVLLAIDAVLNGVEDVMLDDVMEAMSSAVRSALIAGVGRKLVVSDLSNIEGRMLAWLAGEEWKLEAFRQFDLGLGPDLYVASYARSFNMDPADVDKKMRQIGKVQELALGYEGGVGAFVTFAAVYGMDLNLLADSALPTFSAEVLHDAERMYQWAKRKGHTLGLSQRVYVACEGLKRLWRDAHPATVRLWRDVESAARYAILHPNDPGMSAGRLHFDRRGAWLRMRLPSGRYLLYPNPKIGEDGSIRYAAWNVYKKAWCHEATYGGKLVENGDQAASRDIMAHGMLAAEAADYPIVLTVHDELVTEPLDDPKFTPAGLSRILATAPAWAKGLPLAAKGFESYRYRKDD